MNEIAPANRYFRWLGFGIAGLATTVILLMAWSHHRWLEAMNDGLSRLAALEQSRQAGSRAELLMERILGGDRSIDQHLVVAAFTKAQSYSAALREGRGILVGARPRSLPPAALGDVAKQYEQALGNAEALIRARLLSPEKILNIDIQAANAAISHAATEVESILVQDFVQIQHQQRYLDSINITIATLLSLVAIVWLKRTGVETSLALSALGRSESRLRAFADAIPGVSLLLDREGGYVEAFGVDATLLADPRESLVGKRMHDILPASLADNFVRMIREVLDSHTSRRLEYPLALPNRETRHFESRLNPAGDGIHVVCVCWDVSEHWQSEQRIHALKRLYEFLSNVNQAIVWSRQRDRLFETICNTAVSTGEFGLAWISWQTADGEMLECLTQAGQISIETSRLHESLAQDANGPGAQVFRNASLMMLDRLPASGNGWLDIAREQGWQAYAGIPLCEGDIVVAVLNLVGASLDPHDAEEQALLHEVGIDISHALTLFAREAEQRRVEQRVRLLAAAFDSCRDGVVITRLDGTIVATNPSFTRITGYIAEEILGRTPALLRSGRHGANFYRSLWESLQTTGVWQGEIWNRRKNGEIYAQWMSISTVPGTTPGNDHYVAVFTDITHQKDTEERLKHLAHFDPLTDLPNRFMLNSRLEHALELAKRHDRYLAVLFIDLDNFKHVNDALGHAAGDALLIETAHRMGSRLRKQDTLGRLGGDEFLLILESLNSPQDAATVAQDILASLDEPIILNSGHTLYVRVSIGISIYPDDGSSTADLIRDADAAMYQAKRAGRSTYRYYTEALTAAASYRIKMEGRLREAFDRNEFSLYYQPLISLKDDRLIGAEALTRLQPPEMEPISPATFIPLLEETGLIVRLGDWVMRTACHQGQQWIESGCSVGYLTINISPLEIQRGELEQRLDTILCETGFPAGNLVIEITESGLMEQGEHSQHFVAATHAMSVRLSIDDFGTGYSSLAYLRNLPVDTLKIDRSFIMDIPGSPADAKLAAAIIAMAHSLGITVLAEGVETEAQKNFLKEHGCDACQGYLFSPPLPAEEFARRYLGRNRS